MRFVLPKGRLLQKSLEILRNAGYNIDKPGERRLIERFNGNEVLLARAFDVPVYVEHGVDVGIAGSDVLEERGSDVFVPLELPFGKCRLSLAMPAESVVSPEDMDGFRIATKYERITRNYFSKLGLEVEIIKLSGSVELAPKVGVADAIVDIVETGETSSERPRRGGENHGRFGPTSRQQDFPEDQVR